MTRALLTGIPIDSIAVFEQMAQESYDPKSRNCSRRMGSRSVSLQAKKMVRMLNDGERSVKSAFLLAPS